MSHCWAYQVFNPAESVLNGKFSMYLDPEEVNSMRTGQGPQHNGTNPLSCVALCRELP